MEVKTQKVPKKALLFNEQSDGVLSFSAKEEGEGQKLTMLGYSGALMDHWWWGKVAVDVKGVKFGRKPYPILEDHMTEKKIGVAFSAETKDNKIFFPEIKPLKNQYAEEVLNNMEAGFPYQASISIKPSKIEQIKEGSSAEVNGFTVKGPAVIFRESLFRESSVCTFGVDNNTETKAFSEREEDLVEFSYSIVGEENIETEEKIMDLKELKEKHPNLVFSIEKEVMDAKDVELSAKDEELSVKNTEIETLKTEITSLSDQLKEKDEQLQEFNRKEVLRKEQDMKASADHIMSEMLNASALPARLHDKIKAFVNYSDFVKEEALDEAAFKAKVEGEIKEWEETFAETTPVKGTGRKTSVDNSEDEDVDRLFNSVQG